jgi:toxin FitB
MTVMMPLLVGKRRRCDRKALMAFLLDTNVLSELRRGSRTDPNVTAWYATTESRELFISVLVIGEIRHGIEKKRAKDPLFARKLERWLRGIMRDYQSNILAITLEVAEVWGFAQPQPDHVGA